MTKAEVVKQIARETGIEAVTVAAVVEEFMEQVRKAPSRKVDVSLRGFGTFLVKHRKAKTARNISKNTTVIVPERDVPAFRPSKEFVKLLK